MTSAGLLAHQTSSALDLHPCLRVRQSSTIPQDPFHLSGCGPFTRRANSTIKHRVLRFSKTQRDNQLLL